MVPPNVTSPSTTANNTFPDSSKYSKGGIILEYGASGSSLDIVQTNFKGTSNIFSPFLYYNKSTQEKFL
jgi:hypothetical protein